jgi:queuine/archaeosine tRNA-ribosyltransferase
MYLKLMADIRAALAAGTFAEFRRQYAASYVPTAKILADREEALEAPDEN